MKVNMILIFARSG